ncbi:hypothetical protein WMF28_27970 [Sorangium sp. So ce590]|uniref:hypothetical protein n=1 Tax=Sorangium sp. So ce590 TaxID=3133317 RepID=UPI003F5F816F
MATIDDYAKKYASQIAQAATTVTKAKTASADRASFEATVSSILSDIDSLTYSDTGAKLASADEETLLKAVDKALGIEVGVMVLVKKSSIQGALAYENALAALMQQVQSTAQAKK